MILTATPKEITNDLFRLLVTSFGAIPEELAMDTIDDVNIMTLGVALCVPENNNAQVTLTSRFTELDALRLLRGYERR
jgi:hypothetical protein